ncbi:hypothetical protein J6590_093172 [Homalodisca vitripennis]|nr:hypothetical protein J6590_093172 [Homalodisca vitripennis]
MAFICQDTRPSLLKNSANFLLVSKALLECELVERAVLNDGSAVPVERHRPGKKLPLSVSSWSIQPLSKYLAGDVVLKKLWRVHAHTTIKSTVSKSTSISLPKMRNLLPLYQRHFRPLGVHNVPTTGETPDDDTKIEEPDNIQLELDSRDAVEDQQEG